ncbi:MAG: sugar transferase [Lachnospiraceae bacterium]
MIYKNCVKRLLDIVLSLAALLVLSPVYLVLALLVRVKLGSPVLFHQDRPGKDGKIFKMYKFRSMTEARDEKGELLPDEVRLTRFGKRLRSTSLDELPELLSILKGDMSLVGPRPLLVQYLPLYNERQKHRHDVRPGLTGLAQVNGRNAISWAQKFEYDVEYTEKLSFLLDVKILFKTVENVVKREGIGPESGATMEYFTGRE